MGQQNPVLKSYRGTETLKRMKKAKDKTLGNQTVLVVDTSTKIKGHKMLKRIVLNVVL